MAQSTANEILELWSSFEVPDFLSKYDTVPCIKRLKGRSYFCGMDYASKYYYHFNYFVSRYDHSKTCALETYYLTHDKTKTMAALLHDVATPCFAHVIDYMHHDYKEQETTEIRTEDIIRNDRLLNQYLKEDNIDLDLVIYYLKNSVVDNKRPKLCVDRLDGIVTPSLAWTKSIDVTLAQKILSDAYVTNNEDGQEEISFHSIRTVYMVKKLNEELNIATHSKHDVYLMNLLANIVSYMISCNYITYDQLYIFKESDLCNLINNCSIRDTNLRSMWLEFTETVHIPKSENIQVKERSLKILFEKKRF